MKADGKSLNKIIIIVYLLGCVFISIYTLLSGRGRFELTLLSPLFLLIPFVLERIFKLKRNYAINNMLYVFFFCAFGLGTSANVYSSFPGYDKICHFFSGIVFALVGAYIFELLTEKQNAVKKKPLPVRELAVYLCFVAFFSLSCGYIWEIYEYVYSLITGEDIQKVESTGVVDTMQDLITALLGTVVMVAYFIFRNNKRKINSHTAKR